MVNPSNPTDIYLFVNHNKIVEIISFIISIIVLLLGIFSAYLGLSRAKNNKKELKNCIFIVYQQIMKKNLTKNKNQNG